MNYNFHKHIQIQIKESNRILKLEHFLKEKRYSLIKILVTISLILKIHQKLIEGKCKWTLLFCGIRNTHAWSNITPSLKKKVYQISPWNKNLVSSHTYIYKGKILNSSDLSIIFPLLVLLLFWYVNILYRKVHLQVYILNLLFLKHQNKKKSTWIVHFH